MNSWKFSEACVTALCVGLLFGACGVSETADVATDLSSTDAKTDPGEPTVKSEVVLDAFSSTALDFTPIPQERVFDLAQLVIQGSVLEVVPGRLSGGASESDPLAKRYSAVRIQIESSAKGEVAKNQLWLELPISPPDLQEGMPAGTPLLLMLTVTPDYPDYSNEGSVIPPGETIWVPAHPQGLIIGATDGVVEPFGDDVAVDTTIEEEMTSLREQAADESR